MVWRRLAVIGGAVALSTVLMVGTWFLIRNGGSSSNTIIRRWFTEPTSRPALTNRRDQVCPDAPFILPSEGLIGLLYADPAGPYSIVRRHTGIDIFGDGAPGTVPIYAAYAGYLLRRANWISTVAIRHDDPLQAGRTIWTYYTHMADKTGATSFIVDDFPPDSQAVWVEQGTLLGYQGEYAGPSGWIGMHLHFSIVQSDSGGGLLNELELGNTLDPAPYLGMPLGIDAATERPIACF
jgi:peptidoglycan LD-endopeptidase LytH